MKGRRWAIGIAVLLLTALLAGCSGASKNYDSSSDVGDMGWMEENGSGGAAAPQQDNGTDGDTDGQTDKIVYTGYLDAETTAFDSAQQGILSMVEELGGYFSQRSTNNRGTYRYASYEIRIPAERFQDFFLQIGESCHVTNSDYAEERINNVYYDVEARLKTQRTKLERLQNLLSKAETMEDIITIESAISDTELMVEQLAGELKGYDDQVAYATIHMSLQEVYRLSGDEEPATSLGQRLGQAFRGGLRNAGSVLENLTVALAYGWVWILLVAAIAAGAILWIRRRQKRRNALEAARKSDQENKGS